MKTGYKAAIRLSSGLLSPSTAMVDEKHFLSILLERALGLCQPYGRELTRGNPQRSYRSDIDFYRIFILSLMSREIFMEEYVLYYINKIINILPIV